jgi:NADH:ubiquinone reductase (H+-translocating)
MNARHRVVIIGGGFGGLYAAKAMRDHKDLSITILDRRNFHLFQPLLYQVATGGLSAGDIASPLRAVFRRDKHVTVLMAEVTGIDVAGRRVMLADGDVPYDSLIVAAGASHDYFGNLEWEEFAPGLKTVEDATEIRTRVLLAFEAAEREPDPEIRRAWLTFAIVGAGPTGVELAGAIAEIANDTLRGDFRRIDPTEARVLLIDAAPRVLPPYPPDLSSAAERALIQLGVRSLLNVKVTAVDASGVTYEPEDGPPERLEARTVLWAAGVKASPLGKNLAGQTGSELDKAGRIAVLPDLTLPSHPEIFVIGDMALCKGEDGKPLPGVAPVAMQQGRYVAKAIAARKAGRTAEQPFRYWNKGNLATIGKSKGVADFGRVRFNGFAAWLVWLFVHLMYLVGFENRLIVFIQWGFHYLTAQRRARMITGVLDPRLVRRPPENRESATILRSERG